MDATTPAVKRLGQVVVIVVTMIVPLGCTPGARTACAPGASPSSRVTGPELQSANVPGLLEAIQRVRPRFVQTRVPRRNQFAMVYVDGTPIGDVNQMRSIPVADVIDVVFMSASDATTRFGTDHTGGALLVRTNVLPRPPRCSGG